MDSAGKYVYQAVCRRTFRLFRRCTAHSLRMVAFADWPLSACGGILCGKGQEAESAGAVSLRNSEGLVEKAFWKRTVIRRKDGGIVLAHCFEPGHCYGEPVCVFRRAACRNHRLMAGPLFVLLDLFPVRRFVPGALLLLEGVTFIIGCQVHAVSHVMYGMWGMYLQSSFCEAGGFSAGPVIAAEVVLPAAGFLIGREYLKKEINLV